MRLCSPSTRSSRGMMSWITRAATAASAAAVSACAPAPHTIQAAYVSPLEYTALTCEQRNEESARLSQRWSELNTYLTRRHDRDTAFTGGAVVLSAPMALLIKGGSASAEVEYSQIQGRMRALDEASRKGCRWENPPKVEPMIAPGSAKAEWLEIRDKANMPHL